MPVFALIADGKVANLALYGDDAEKPEGAVDVTSMSPQPAIGWVFDGKTFSPPQADVSISGLATSLVAAADAACDAVTAQIIPSATYSQAYQNAATIVWANGGKAPTADPQKTIFAAQGASVGINDPDAFAQVVTAVSLGSMQLAAILATLKGTALRAKSINGLNGALSTFEQSLGEFVSHLNAAGLTVTVEAPPTIAVPGLTA